MNHAQLLAILLSSDPGGADDDYVEHAVSNEAAENADATNDDNNSDDSEDD